MSVSIWQCQLIHFLAKSFFELESLSIYNLWRKVKMADFRGLECGHIARFNSLLLWNVLVYNLFWGSCFAFIWNLCKLKNSCKSKTRIYSIYLEWENGHMGRHNFTVQLYYVFLDLWHTCFLLTGCLKVCCRSEKI